MNSTDIKTVELIVNNKQAKQKLEEINKQLEVARRKKHEAFEKGDTSAISAYQKEITRLERAQRKATARATDFVQVLRHLDKATPKELRDTINNINRELSSGAVERGSKEWNTLTKALRECNKQLEAIKKESENAKNLPTRIAKFGEKWIGFIGSVQMGLQAFTGIRQTLRGSVQEFAEMEEHMSQVRKYTGMTTEQVHDLNEELKKIDTRTPREKLNDLAGDAGRLGIQLKRDVLDFVDAGTGKGYAHKKQGNNGNLEFLDPLYRIEHHLGEQRKKKRWFSPSWYISVRVLKERIAAMVGESFSGLFDNLTDRERR